MTTARTMDLYSTTLSLALAAAGGAALAALAVRFGARSARAAARGRRGARIAALASLPLVALSLTHHLATGHRPGTPGGMSWSEFVREHPSFAAVVLLAGLALWWLRRERD